jgi:predicted naringenin-chalcone synthase
LSKIISIGTALPPFRHRQEDIRHFMQRIYAFNEYDRRRLGFLYQQSGIGSRYSVLNDYGQPPGAWTFYPATENLEPFPTLEERMQVFDRYAPELSVLAVRNCLGNRVPARSITHLITVTCTGLSAPGLDLQLMERLDLPSHVFRTSVNFMGCYAAIHALKLADTICRCEPDARVMIVCTELCTLHFQQEATMDNIMASLLFGDGSAAVWVSGDADRNEGLPLQGFYAEVKSEGKQEMSWALSSTGFRMTLRSYIPGLIEADFAGLVENALAQVGQQRDSISAWCIHPGGRRILDAIAKSLSLPREKLGESYAVLRQYGNMSSPTILFVLDEIMKKMSGGKPERIFGAAFGPGLTMETFIAGY